MKKASKVERASFIASDYMVTELIDEVLEYFCYVRLTNYSMAALDYDSKYEYESELFSAMVNLYTFTKRFYGGEATDTYKYHKEDFLTSFWEKMFYDDLDTVKLFVNGKLKLLRATEGVNQDIISNYFVKISEDWVRAKNKIIEAICSGSIITIENFIYSARYGSLI
jgi:hypothetical protein